MQEGRTDASEACALVPARLLASSAAAIKLYVYLYLYEYTNGRRLSEDLHMSRNTVKAALTELVDSGEVVKTGAKYRLSDGSESEPNGSETDPSLARARLPVYEQEQEIRNHYVVSQRAGVSDSPPPLTKVDGQNLAFNALTLVCAVPKNRAAEVAVALSGGKAVPIGIRAQFAEQLRERNLSKDGEDFERALVEAIEVHAAAYRQTLPPGSMLTPTALAKWWSSLPAMYQQRKVAGRQTAAQKMLAKAKEAAQ